MCVCVRVRRTCTNKRFKPIMLKQWANSCEPYTTKKKGRKMLHEILTFKCAPTWSHSIALFRQFFKQMMQLNWIYYSEENKEVSHQFPLSVDNVWIDVLAPLTNCRFVIVLPSAEKKTADFVQSRPMKWARQTSVCVCFFTSLLLFLSLSICLCVCVCARAFFSSSSLLFAMCHAKSFRAETNFAHTTNTSSRKHVTNGMTNACIKRKIRRKKVHVRSDGARHILRRAT